MGVGAGDHHGRVEAAGAGRISQGTLGGAPTGGGPDVDVAQDEARQRDKRASLVNRALGVLEHLDAGGRPEPRDVHGGQAL